MNDAPEKIIVFESYESSMMANLVKTKLDAYGIPCFLSGEHFNNMIPIKNDLIRGVSLHIFERDLDQVKGLLADISLS